MRESILRQVDKNSGVPNEEKPIQDSQGEDRGLAFSRKRKGRFFLFVCLFFYKPRADDCTTKQLILLKDMFSLNL